MTGSSRYGGEVVCNAEVTKISVEHGRAAGVHVHDQLVRVRRAVLADVSCRTPLRSACHALMSCRRGCG